MRFKIINKETGKDETESLNPCLHHSGSIILLMANDKWYSLEEVNQDNYEIIIKK